MKKVFFTTVLAFLINLGWSQTESYIFVNPTADYKGTMYSVPNGSGSYTVLKSNTIYSVAKMHGMSVANLKDMNGLSDNKIVVGQILKVRATSTVGSGLKLNADATAPELIVGASKSFEAPSSAKPEVLSNTNIATNHAVWGRAEVLKKEGKDIESLKGKEISRGDTVLWFVAGNEDSYHTIATKFDMSFEDLKSINEMGDYLLKPGMVLIVEKGVLYGMKEMPENMPALAEEKVLTTEEAKEMMQASEETDIYLNEEQKKEEVEAINNAEDVVEELVEDIKEDSSEAIEEVEHDITEDVEFSDEEEVEMDW